MCEFVSFIELKDNIYFLTNDCLRTKEGKALKEYLGSAYADDIKGHGAIRRYFGLPDNKGTNLEIYDFANPNKFPAAIVEAIKSGAMSKIAPPPKGILTAPLYADYKAKQAPLDADYKAKQAPLDADYEAKKAPLYADYQAKQDALDTATWKLITNPRNRVKEWE